jgi:ATP-binding cassette subfamily C protein LapB
MGALIGCVIISGRAMAPVAQVAAVLSRTNVAVESFRRVNEFMLVTSREEETRGYVKRGAMSGPIAIKNLTFRYPESHTKLFDNLTLEVEKSSKVAMLGRIGSGKSTFLRLCLGLYLPDDGIVMVDGTNITQVRPEDLRKNFGVVPQTVSLFSGTVGENIAIGVDDYDDKLLVRVAEVAGVMSWLSKTPNGFDYKLSEGGKELSGGQRQTIAIARALIRKPHYIILDEPTANMDTATEQLVLKNLAEYLNDETVVIVTHRMAPLSLVDRIVVLDNGRVNVDGPKEKIIERLKGAA